MLYKGRIYDLSKYLVFVQYNLTPGAARDIASLVSPYSGFSNNDVLTGMVRYVVGVENTGYRIHWLRSTGSESMSQVNNETAKI